MLVFVAGSTGFLGRRMVKALVERGHKVRCLVRGGSEHKLPDISGIERFITNFSNTGRLAQGMEGCDAVVNSVGIIREFPRKGITFHNVHIDFTGMMLEAAVEAGVNMFIYVSALGADTGPRTGYNISKLEAEKLVGESVLNWTILRPSVIFGQGDAFTDYFARQIQKRLPIPLIGGGRYLLQPVSVEDLAEGCARLIDNDFSYGRIYNIGGNYKLAFIEIIDLIAEAGGKMAIKVRVPIGLIKFAAVVLGGFKWFPISKGQVDMLTSGNVTSDDDFWRHSGIHPRTFREEVKS